MFIISYYKKVNNKLDLDLIFNIKLFYHYFNIFSPLSKSRGRGEGEQMDVLELETLGFSFNFINS